jgi:hypothetical protein
MAGPKKREKLTKPGLGYGIQKALTKFANKQSKVGVGFMSMGEFIATGPGRADANKIIAKYEKKAAEKIASRDKDLKKARFKSIQKQKAKKKG